MANGRRGGPPDLKGTLGILLRTTLDQVGAVKDVVEQQARNQRERLDQALDDRRRREALTGLGEALYALALRGELGELALEPTIAQHLSMLGEIDAQDGAQSFDHGVEAVSSSSYQAPKTTGEYRVWRPVMPEDDEAEAVDSPPEPKASEKRSASSALHRPRRVASRSGGGIHFIEEKPRPGDPDSDDDLAEYMHDDDVPSGS